MPAVVSRVSGYPDTFGFTFRPNIKNLVFHELPENYTGWLAKKYDKDLTAYLCLWQSG